MAHHLNAVKLRMFEVNQHMPAFDQIVTGPVVG